MNTDEHQKIYGMYTVKWANNKMTRILCRQDEIDQEVALATRLHEADDKEIYGEPILVHLEFCQNILYGDKKK